MNSKLFYLLIVIFLIISVSVAGETTGNRIIDKKEIEASGITQLSEIFTLIPEWPASSIDGVTWRVSPNGLEPFHHQRWKIILDDVLLDFDFWGTKPLDMIPINISQIVFIEVINIPGIYFGEFVESGALHFHTIDSNKKTTLKIEGNLANETGDPGPYRYTKHTSSNVDRLAENIGIVFEKKFNNSSFSINFKNSVHFPTDPVVFEDNSEAIEGEFPKQNLLSGGIKCRIDKLDLSGGMSYFEDFHDFYYLVTKALNNSHHFLNVSYPMYISNNLNITTKINISSNSIKDHWNKYLLLNKKIVKPSIRLDYTNSKYKISSVFEYKSYKNKLKDYVNNDGYTLENINIFKSRLLFDYSFSKKINNSISFEYYQNFNKYNSAFSDKLEIKIDNHHSLLLGGFIGIQFFEDLNYYMPSLFRDIYISPIKGYHENVNYLSFLEWVYNHSENLQIKLTFFHNYYYNYCGDSQNCRIDGNIFSNQLSVKYNNNNFRAKLYYGLSLNSKDLETYDPRKSIPKYTIQLTMNYSLYSDISFWGKIKYTSSTFWTYHDSTLDDMLIADLTIRKKLMKNKAVFTFGLRNILNDTQRYHPSGASFDLNYFVRFYINVI